jgi:hypothetical protein
LLPQKRRVLVTHPKEEVAVYEIRPRANCEGFDLKATCCRSVACGMASRGQSATAIRLRKEFVTRELRRARRSTIIQCVGMQDAAGTIGGELLEDDRGKAAAILKTHALRWRGSEFLSAQ